MSKSKTPAGATAPSKAAPSSSIDDIFASSSKSKPKAAPTTSNPAGPSSKSKVKLGSSHPAGTSTSKRAAVASANDSVGGADKPKKKKKKGRNIAAFDPAEQEDEKGEPPIRAVEVVDTTVPPVKSGSVSVGKEAQRAGKKRERKEDEEDEAFRDSRGTSEWSLIRRLLSPPPAILSLFRRVPFLSDYMLSDLYACSEGEFTDTQDGGQRRGS